MKSIINGKVFYKGEFHEDLVLVYETSVKEVFSVSDYKDYRSSNKIIEETDAKGSYVLPGFIDVHIHGYKGIDTMDGDPERLEEMAELIGENGVTAFLPTTMTMSMGAIRNALDSIRVVQQKTDVKGAIILGAHLEGPFISEGFKGAQSAVFIHLPDEALIEQYLDIIKVITIAPEVDGAMEMISNYKDQINFSLGHTGATYEQAKEAYEIGATGTTHLFNAMTGIHHRKPGVVGAALNGGCYSEVIADNIHLNPGLFKMIARTKGLDKLLLITDCMRAGGLDEGIYTLGGQEVIVKNGQCRLTDGTLAGSVLKLNEGLKNFTLAIEEELAEAIPMVTINQAKYLGVENRMGTLDQNKEANIVLMNEAFFIETTIVKGKKIYESRV
ncbi:MAG: N-acetylglucosamine-6-phosphate deacetylase [Vallitaleaceae bacterium]|nr:N-acetylglucosamine-6-phosphate deacetylase [Vallitaleaceae bacterium]